MASLDTTSSAFAPDEGSLGSTTTVIQIADSSEPTFTCFPKLPPELKLMIWKFFNTPERRDIEVVIQFAYGDMKNNYKTSTPIPSILHVCADARRGGLKTYKTMFNIDFPGQPTPPSHEIYINPDIDTVYIRIPRWTEGWYWRTYGLAPNTVPAMSEGSLNEKPWGNSTHSFYRVRIQGGDEEARFEEDEVVMLILPIKPVHATYLKRAGEIADIVERIGGQNLGKRGLHISSWPVSHFWTVWSQLICDLMNEDKGTWGEREREREPENEIEEIKESEESTHDLAEAST